MNTLELQKQANEIRKGIIAAVHSAKSGHPGGSLSAADIFTYLYFEEMNIDPKKSENGGQRPFRTVKRTCSTGTLCSTGTPRIFSGRRSDNTSSCGFLLTGTS